MSVNEQPAGQQSLIKTPQQLIAVISLALLVPVVLFVLLSQFMANMRSVDKDSAEMTPDAVAKRLKPVGDVAFADARGGATKTSRSGEEIYKSVCSACHASGAAGAPKLGEKGDWAPRLKQGEKMLVENAIKGVGKMMPARGGNAELSDLEVASAVVYLSNSVGARFKEPAAPVAEKTAAAPAAEKAAVPAAGKTDGKKIHVKESAAAAPQTTTAGAGSKTDGKKIYDATCTPCHGPGIAGAPKAGDKAAWAPRMKSGMDALYASALKGKGAMPAKGGNNALADADVKAAVDYLIGLAK